MERADRGFPLALGRKIFGEALQWVVLVLVQVLLPAGIVVENSVRLRVVASLERGQETVHLVLYWQVGEEPSVTKQESADGEQHQCKEENARSDKDVALPRFLLHIELWSIQQRHRRHPPCRQSSLLDTENAAMVPESEARLPPSECAFEYLELSDGAQRIHRYNIEAYRDRLSLCLGKCSHVDSCKTTQHLALMLVHLGLCRIHVARSACLHLDKAKQFADPRDQIQVATHLGAGPATGDHNVSAPPKLEQRRPLAPQSGSQVRSCRRLAPSPRAQTVHPQQATLLRVDPETCELSRRCHARG